MEILHLSTEDVAGGAARATLRLNQGLERIGISSKILVRNKQSSSPSIVKESSLATKLGPVLDRLILERYPEHDNVIFSSQWFLDGLSRCISALNPDLVHLHWVCDGFLKIETLQKIKKPIVWTLHDMWPLTGGCHYSQGCNRYEDECGNCPILHSYVRRDLSFRILSRKERAWKDLDLTIVTPSVWLSNCAKTSRLFKDRRIEVIPNGVDTTVYRPGLKRFAREILNLPQDKNLLLFVAGSTTGDPRKGFNYLMDALNKVQVQNLNSFELIILGEEASSVRLPWKFQTRYLGKFNDEISLVLAYNAADVFVAPSVEDNLPNTVIEALACGTPCVAFNIGGMPDMIDHQLNGYLAMPFDTDNLAQGIKWVISDPDLQEKLGHNARAKVMQSFDVLEQAKKFYKLYEELVRASS